MEAAHIMVYVCAFINTCSCSDMFMHKHNANVPTHTGCAFSSKHTHTFAQANSQGLNACPTVTFTKFRSSVGELLLELIHAEHPHIRA